jgi:hypothetical protein
MIDLRNVLLDYVSDFSSQSLSSSLKLMESVANSIQNFYK